MNAEDIKSLLRDMYSQGGIMAGAYDYERAMQ